MREVREIRGRVVVELAGWNGIKGTKCSIYVTINVGADALPCQLQPLTTVFVFKHCISCQKYNKSKTLGLHENYNTMLSHKKSKILKKIMNIIKY